MKIKSLFIKLFLKYSQINKKMSDRKVIKTLYKISFGKTPDLDNPKTFNEHICALKNSEKLLGYSKYVDKAAVREYVKNTVGEKYLNQVYGVYEKAEDIPFENLPEKFVLKCTHASGFNIIVKDKKSLNIDNTIKKLNNWLSTNYYWLAREKNYKNIKPAVLVDKYIEGGETLNEYKLFCFNGKVKFIDVNLFEGAIRRVSVYSPEWEYIPVNMGYANAGDCIEKPDNLQELIDIAEKLAKPFEFVRVDLYNNKNIIFSELTFTSGGGIVNITPTEYDTIFGSFFEEKQ